MKLTDSNLHHIQKYIIGVLMHNKYARFRDMRPPNVDTNLYSYHLSKLMSGKLVEKMDAGYTLSLTGLQYVDQLTTETMNIRKQPKLVAMLVVRDAGGRILLQKRKKQPYINTWSLPFGKIHNEDESVISAAKREGAEKIGDYSIKDIVHNGDCYIKIEKSGIQLLNLMAHVFCCQPDHIQETETTKWVDVSDIDQLETMPGVDEVLDIVRQSQKHFFFKEFYICEE